VAGCPIYLGMKDMLKKRLMRTVVIVICGLVVGGGLAWVQMHQDPAAQVIKPAAQTMAGADIGGPFSLVDQDGKTVTDKDFAGQWTLVYFGFSYCPMICPTELQKIAKALNDMGPAGEKIQPIFITTDPGRDTPDVMKKYVEQFHPRLIGLTGDAEQVKSVQRTYRVYAKKIQTEENTEYTMDHSSFIYLMNPEGKLVSIYRTTDTADFIAADITEKTGA
jgi:protein SCO1/2